MRSLSGVKYLLCVMDVFTKYAWVKPLKNKRAKTVPRGFVETVNKSKCKPNELLIDQGIRLKYGYRLAIFA